MKLPSFRWIFLALSALGILVYLFAPALGWGLGIPFFSQTTELRADPSTLVFARVDWNDGLRVVPVADFTHATLDLNYHHPLEFGAADLRVLKSAGPVMITVRTWSLGANSFDDNPLKDVVEGKYDDLLGRFARALPAGGKDVYLRFNPDGEVPVQQYPWQQYPSVFIDAFARFASICREVAPGVKLVWAPAGYPGAMEYYPGDSLVDAASVTYRYAAERQLDAYPHDLPPVEDLYRRLHRLRFLRIPVFAVTEEDYDGTLPDLDSLQQKLSGGPEAVYGHPPAAPDGQPSPHRTEQLIFGVYDPQERLLTDPAVTAEHIFLDFDRIEDGRFAREFSEVTDRGHDVIVTFEPFHHPIEESDTNVLRNVVAGVYDEALGKLMQTLRSTRQRVFFRYAHEMEIPIHRYPWQSRDPQDYIASWRYVMQFDTLPSNVYRVWGPAGDRGFLEWYPGDDYVDAVSIAIYGLPDKNIEDPEKQESFARIYDRKMWRMRFVDKPVFITEFGVKGPEAYQTQWMEAAARVLAEDPRVIGINYFNMSDTPKAWGDIKPPDWSITPATMRRFLEEIRAPDSR